MDHLYAEARADGITVPIFHNDQGRNGRWVPPGTDVPGTVEGPVDLYAFDGYPGGTCTVQGEVTRNSPAPDWGFYGPGGARGGASASLRTPGFLAEFGGGWFDYWGSNGGYECNARQRGRYYQRVFYGTALANGIYLQSFYMTYGGANWGWLAAPVVYTSYDYGAAISEIREVRPKALELKQLGQLLAAAPDIAGMIPAGPVEVSSRAIQVYHNRSPETDARFLMVTHQPSNAQTDDRFTIGADLPDGRYVLPQEGAMRLDGFDAKWLLAGIDLGGQRLVYSTSQLQTHVTIDGRDVALFYGRTGEDGETVLRYASAPRVTVIAGEVRSRFDAARGDLRLNYSHSAPSRVSVEGGGRARLLLIFGDEDEGVRWWRQDTGLGPVIERGPALVRRADARGASLRLTGDVSAPASMEIFAPAGFRSIYWNGARLALVATASGSLATRRELAGPEEIALPELLRQRMDHRRRRGQCQHHAPARRPAQSGDGRVWLSSGRCLVSRPLSRRRTGSAPDDALWRGRRRIVAGLARRRLPGPG
jgi:Beta-galactosidase, domain 2/Glycosyl hydrolases family 35/Beta-galactosidase, domain 3